MSINSNAIRNRIEISFYSALIAVMSGINHIRSRLYRPAPTQTAPEKNIAPVQVIEVPAQQTLDTSWAAIGQSLASILIWTVLGFAAGFLIGMINPG